MKNLFIIITCILAFSFTYSIQAQNNDTKKETTITVKVKGLTCSSDCIDISNKVKELKGVSYCDKTGKPGASTKFKIKYNPAKVKYNEIINAIEDTPGCSDPNARPYKVKGKKK